MYHPHYYDEGDDDDDDDDDVTSEEKKLFFMASALGHINRIEQYLDDGMDIETKDYVFGETIFMRACRQNHVEALEIIHCRNANVNAFSYTGETALHIAAKNNSLLCLDYLLSIPQVDLNFPDKLGQSALMIAAQKGHVKCVELLIEANCDVHMLDCHGRSALHFALDPYSGVSGNYNALLCLQCLCQKDFDINQSDLDGNTPLHIAIKKMNWKAIVWLVNENCDIDKVGTLNPELHICKTFSYSQPTSPLLLALNFLNFRVVRYLILCGCSYYYCHQFLPYCEKDANLHAFLEEQFSKPRPLKVSCRSVIRKCLGRFLADKLKSLNIPLILQDFLLLQDVEVS